MTNKARRRLAARVHKQFKSAIARSKREAEREMRRIYPVRVGQRYVNRDGGRYIVEKVEWGVGDALGPWPQGPLVVLRYDAEDFRFKTVKFWDELAKDYHRTRPSKER